MAVKTGNNPLFFEIIKMFKNSVHALPTLESLLTKMVEPGEEFGLSSPLLKVDDFKEIFEILGGETAQHLLDKNY